jgi:hypothetical protein
VKLNIGDRIRLEAVRQAVPVKRTAGLGLEGTLSEHDLRRLAKVPEREVDEGLDVVGIGVLPSEGVCETGRWIDHAELPGQIEAVALRRPHLDPVALPDARVELQARGAEALRPPPPRELVPIGEGLEHARSGGGKGTIHLEREAV